MLNHYKNTNLEISYHDNFCHNFGSPPPPHTHTLLLILFGLGFFYYLKAIFCR